MPTTPRFPCAALAALLSLLAWSRPGLGAGKSKLGAATAGSPLQIMVDRSKVDLKAHRLEIKLSRKPSKVSIRVEAESGAVLTDLDGRPWAVHARGVIAAATPALHGELRALVERSR